MCHSCRFSTLVGCAARRGSTRTPHEIISIVRHWVFCMGIVRLPSLTPTLSVERSMRSIGWRAGALAYPTIVELCNFVCGFTEADRQILFWREDRVRLCADCKHLEHFCWRVNGRYAACYGCSAIRVRTQVRRRCELCRTLRSIDGELRYARGENVCAGEERRRRGKRPRARAVSIASIRSAIAQRGAELFLHGICLAWRGISLDSLFCSKLLQFIAVSKC